MYIPGALSRCYFHVFFGKNLEILLGNDYDSPTMTRHFAYFAIFQTWWKRNMVVATGATDWETPTPRIVVFEVTPHGRKELNIPISVV